jgi:hypothetical protein
MTGVPDVTTEKPRSSLAKVLMGLSTPGVLALLLYFLVDYGCEEPIRGPVKTFVDHQHFLLYAAVVFPSILVFGVCGIFMIMQRAQWSAEAHPSHYPVLRPVVHVTCQILLTAVGSFVGYSAPIWWLLIQGSGSIRTPVWSAPVVFTVIALGAEWLCSRRHRPWLRPVVWGAVAGSLALLVCLLSTGWDIDLSM